MTPLMGIGIQLSLAVIAAILLFVHSGRCNYHYRESYRDMAGTLVFASILGDILAYNVSFNGGSLLYSAISVAGCSSVLFPLAIGGPLADIADWRRWQRGADKSLSLLPGMAMVLGMFTLLGIGAWAGAMNSSHAEHALLIGGVAVSAGIVFLAAIYVWFMGTFMQSAGVG